MRRDLPFEVIGVFDTYDPIHGCGAPVAGLSLALPGPTGLEYYLAAGGQPRFIAWPADAAARQAIAPPSVAEDEFRLHQPSDFGTGYQGLFFLPTLAPVTANCTAHPVRSYS